MHELINWDEARYERIFVGQYLFWGINGHFKRWGDFK